MGRTHARPLDRAGLVRPPGLQFPLACIVALHRGDGVARVVTMWRRCGCPPAIHSLSARLFNRGDGLPGLVAERSSGRVLRRQHSPSDCLRQRDRTEECLRIEVILSGLIDDPQHVVLPGRGIAQRHVDFAFLERDRITVVFHADDQLSCCLCSQSGDPMRSRRTASVSVRICSRMQLQLPLGGKQDFRGIWGFAPCALRKNSLLRST
jgi:hypothetical protein